MKIYTYTKHSNNKKLKLFGCTIFQNKLCYEKRIRYKKFLKGFITITTIYGNNYSYRLEGQIRIFGKSLIKWDYKDDFVFYYFINKEIYRVRSPYSPYSQFINQYIKPLGNAYDHIYMIMPHIGETYLLLTYIIDILIKKDNSKKPLLVLRYKYHADIIQMICPNIPYIFFNITNVDSFNFKERIISSNVRISVPLPMSYFEEQQLDKDLWIPNNKCHYFDHILKYLDIEYEDIAMRPIIVPEIIKQTMRNKINKTGLNFKKFVFLAIEAQSIKTYSNDFWEELITKLQSKGYDVFINLTQNNTSLNKDLNYKTSDLTLGEAFALAQQAKKIVILRSGLAEFLLQTGTDMYVLNSSTTDWLSVTHTSEEVQSYFNLNKLPFVSKENIHQLNISEMSVKHCIKNILSE